MIQLQMANNVVFSLMQGCRLVHNKEKKKVLLLIYYLQKNLKKRKLFIFYIA